MFYPLWLHISPLNSLRQLSVICIFKQPVPKTQKVSGHHYTPVFFPPAGAVGSGGVHQGRQGHCIAAICGNDPDAYWGSPGCIPQIDEHGKAAHLCGNRQCPLCVPASGETLHGSHHHQEQQHPGGLGDSQTVLSCGKETWGWLYDLNRLHCSCWWHFCQSWMEHICQYIWLNGSASLIMKYRCEWTTNQPNCAKAMLGTRQYLCVRDLSDIVVKSGCYH